MKKLIYLMAVNLTIILSFNAFADLPDGTYQNTKYPPTSTGWVTPVSSQEFTAGLSYKTQAIEKPDDFVDLRIWVENMCAMNSVTCFNESFGELIIGSGTDQGKDAFEYVTEEDGVYYRNTVVDDGIHLNLYTFADPELQSFSDEEDALFLVAPNRAKSKASSCAEQDKCNCVLWVRNCRASWLPTGMTYIWDKKSKINTSSPKSGRVAVHDIYYPYGHVSYIKKVDGSKIEIEEANYSPCKVTSRKKKPSEMSVVGYIKK
jgi:hypothetical protein